MVSFWEDIVSWKSGIFALKQTEKLYYEAMKKLAGKELYRRLQEARNAKRLLARMSQSNEALREIIENQKTIIAAQGKRIILLEKLTEQQALRIEYLERIVFGKSKKKRHGDSDDEDRSGGNFSSKKKDRRDPKTYQREIPKDITNTEEYPLDCCPDCQGPLTNKRTVERYREDIILPDEKKNPLKQVEHQFIESGWCGKCKAQKNAEPINGSKVFLGKNAKTMVVYLSIVMRMSYEQIQNIFRDIYYLKLSDGEIENILEDQGNRLTSEHEKIAKALLEQPAHYDETSWKTLQGAEGNYCWIKTGTKTTDTLFLFGKNRGKGNVKKLYGESTQVGITDDYPGYDKVFEAQALCWAHPNRKLRDLAESEAITGKARKNCKKTYKEFGEMYKELRNIMASEDSFEEKKKCKEHYWNEFKLIAKAEQDDPEKLKIYKTTLRKEQWKYFLFLEIEGISMDNNEAERKLRHVVLKRKISLGSKTNRGAAMLEKLYSVVLTWWWRDPANFIANYRHLLA